jgi:hypothetical protein
MIVLWFGASTTAAEHLPTPPGRWTKSFPTLRLTGATGSSDAVVNGTWVAPAGAASIVAAPAARQTAQADRRALACMSTTALISASRSP